MTKPEFLDQLRRRISNQPPDEIERTISYFSEIIDDRIEDGMDEREAVSSLGSIDDIVREMLPQSGETRLDSYSARDISSITIRDTNCAVILKCTESDEISLDYYENKLKRYDISFTPKGELSVSSEYLQKMLFNFSFKAFRPFVLHLPQTFRGKISLETGNGSINARGVNIEGAFSARTSNASIEITDVVVGDKADMRTTNARITLENLKASDIRASTTNGRINAISVHAQNDLSLQTMNGGIHVRKLNAGKSIFLKTSNAGIHGTIDDNISSFSIVSRTMNAGNSLPSKMKGGSKNLSVHTMNGSIDLGFLK